MKISVIVPVYNTAQFLPRCIDSIISQSFTDFELLLIDDGSIDGSGQICDAYAEKDNRIRVFHKENGGVSSARNMGLDNAKGEWLAFVDSDDLLAEGALEIMAVEVAEDVDMVYGGIRKFDDHCDDLETILVRQKGKISVEQALDSFVMSDRRNGDWQRYMINRIFRRSIVEKFELRFNTELYYKEDGLFVVQFLCRCINDVVAIPAIVYLYRQVTNGAMGSLAVSYNPRLLTNVDSHGFIYKELKKRGVGQEVRGRELAHLFQNYDWISGIMKNAGVYDIKNRMALLRRIMKNGGLLNCFYYRVILRYGRKIKKKLA